MWIRRSEFWKLIETSAEAKVLGRHNEFLTLRVNQLELERAHLLAKATGVELPVPRIVTQADAPRNVAPAPSELLAGMPSFEDMGDDEAARQGVTVDPETGVLVYTK